MTVFGHSGAGIRSSKPLDVRVDHHPNQPREVDRRLPVQVRFRLGRVANQVVHFGGTQEGGVEQVGKEIVALAVVDGDVVGEDLGDAVGAARVEGRLRGPGRVNVFETTWFSIYCSDSTPLTR